MYVFIITLEDIINIVMKYFLKLWIAISVFFLVKSCSNDIIERSLSNESVYYSVAVSSSEGGNVNSTGGYYKYGSEININATSDEGYFFSDWTGVDSLDNPLIIHINSDYNTSAIFKNWNKNLVLFAKGISSFTSNIRKKARDITYY